MAGSIKDKQGMYTKTFLAFENIENLQLFIIFVPLKQTMTS
jgi:hypothetical protein